MAYFAIRGGKPLEGSVTLAGSKNLASKLMIASLLTDQACTLRNVPNIGENQLAQSLLELAGSQIEREGTAVSIHTPTIRSTDLTTGPKNRLPILVIPPLLFRSGEVTIPQPGGDRIGVRPVNFHLDLLRQLGAIVEAIDGGYHVRADTLTATSIALPYPSVGATETALLATVWARGTSRITGAAIEPEVLELIRFLNALGAQISVVGGREFEVNGVTEFAGAIQRVIPDRIEAVSYAALALATRGNILIHEAAQSELHRFLTFVDDIGGEHSVDGDGMRFRARTTLNPTSITTGVHPGFMTDWQQPSAIILLTANGVSTIHETVHERRFGYVEQLKAMGAKIRIEDVDDSRGDPPFTLHPKTQRAIIEGPCQLQGGQLEMPDLRAGMAYMIAALIAKGESELYGIEQVDRGYEKVEVKLRGIGASIARRE